MTTDMPQPETTEPEGGHTAPDPLAMAVASTAEDYTAEKLTPDPGSDIGRALTPVPPLEELPDTAEKPGGPERFQQLTLPEGGDTRTQDEIEADSDAAGGEPEERPPGAEWQ
jgi:hypothetical protein